MRIYPAPHYTMGGLWVDYNLMSTIPGLFVLGEANFSDHGANRLGASALMQGLADGYFVIPYTLGEYLAGTQLARRSAATHPEFAETRRRRSRSRRRSCSASRARAASTRSIASSARSCWDKCGMAPDRRGAEGGDRRTSARCASEYWQDVRVPGDGRGLQPGAREGRPRRRLLRARRADVPRRAASARSRAAATSARSTRPAEGEALRDDARLLPRRGLGVDRGPGRTRSGTSSRSRSRA